MLTYALYVTHFLLLPICKRLLHCSFHVTSFSSALFVCTAEGSYIYDNYCFGGYLQFSQKCFLSCSCMEAVACMLHSHNKESIPIAGSTSDHQVEPDIAAHSVVKTTSHTLLVAWPQFSKRSFMFLL